MGALTLWVTCRDIVLVARTTSGVGGVVENNFGPILRGFVTIGAIK